TRSGRRVVVDWRMAVNVQALPRERRSASSWRERALARHRRCNVRRFSTVPPGLGGGNFGIQREAGVLRAPNPSPALLCSLPLRGGGWGGAADAANAGT